MNFCEGPALPQFLTSSSSAGRPRVFTCPSTEPPQRPHVAGIYQEETGGSPESPGVPSDSDCWHGPWILAGFPFWLLALPTGWNPRLNSCYHRLWDLGFHHCLVAPSFGPSNGLKVPALGCERSCMFCPVSWRERNNWQTLALCVFKQLSRIHTEVTWCSGKSMGFEIRLTTFTSCVWQVFHLKMWKIIFILLSAIKVRDLKWKHIRGLL